MDGISEYDFLYRYWYDTESCGDITMCLCNVQKRSERKKISDGFLHDHHVFQRRYDPGVFEYPKSRTFGYQKRDFGERTGIDF